jgi:hypothetical protein
VPCLDIAAAWHDDSPDNYCGASTRFVVWWQSISDSTAGDATVSAAAQITIFLLGIILTLILATIAGFIGWQWWRERQERQRREKSAQQAELYGLLNGTPRPHSYPHHRPPSLPQGGGNILVFPGSGMQNPPMVQDWRHDDWEVSQ